MIWLQWIPWLMENHFSVQQEIWHHKMICCRIWISPAFAGELQTPTGPESVLAQRCSSWVCILLIWLKSSCSFLNSDRNRRVAFKLFWYFELPVELWGFCSSVMGSNEVAYFVHQWLRYIYIFIFIFIQTVLLNLGHHVTEWTSSLHWPGARSAWRDATCHQTTFTFLSFLFMAALRRWPRLAPILLDDERRFWRRQNKADIWLNGVTGAHRCLRVVLCVILIRLSLIRWCWRRWPAALGHDVADSNRFDATNLWHLSQQFSRNIQILTFIFAVRPFWSFVQNLLSSPAFTQKTDKTCRSTLKWGWQ